MSDFSIQECTVQNVKGFQTFCQALQFPSLGLMCLKVLEILIYMW
jgi:hypothetical protein